MTHQIDAERADFEALCIEKGWNMTAIMLTKMPPEFSCYADIGTQRAYIAWQAARRAPAVPVPQVTPAMIEAVDGWFARNTDLGGCSDKDVAELAAIFAAAPQPPEAEENPLQEPLDEALQSLEFYKRRCDLLQSIQPRMRDPERTMVCDVLANGHLLQGGDGQPDKARYAPPEAAPVQLPEPAAWRDPKNFLPSQGCTYEKSTAKKWAHIYTEALYTEQQVRDLLAAANVERVPLTDERIESLKVWENFVGLFPETRKEITRAIERAHGIGKDKA